MTGAPPCSIGYMLLYQCVFFSKRYGYVTKSIHPFDMYDIPFPGSFPEFCEDDWDSESGTLPSGKRLQKTMEITTFNGKTHYKWPCSIANCYFTRGGSNCYGQKKICELQHKKSSFSHRNPFIKSSNPIQKTMGMCRKNPNVPNRMMILNDHIQSKLWLLWSSPI